MIKEAEICAYFKRFDEAEKLYIEMDRRYEKCDCMELIEWK